MNMRGCVVDMNMRGCVIDMSNGGGEPQSYYNNIEGGVGYIRPKPDDRINKNRRTDFL